MKSQQGYDFLKQTFAYDPIQRLSARDSLKHRWFTEEPIPSMKYALTLLTSLFAR